jgi:uncharacterized protein (DUF58 family)
MRRHELAVLGNRRAGEGAAMPRLAGGNRTFERVKPYVPGDDPRVVNWKATAKLDRLMVNEHVEERARQVYCVMDTGHAMQGAFEGLTLLDHAVNSVLALSNIILKRGDRAGVLAFASTPGTLVRADARAGQLGRICEALYALQVSPLESDFDRLYMTLAREIPTREIVLLFTNFDTVHAMHRHLPALRGLAARHLLLVVLFEDTEIEEALAMPPRSLEEIYFETVATGCLVEKRRIAGELSRAGARVLLVAPGALTPRVINAYLQVKR